MATIVRTGHTGCIQVERTHLAELQVTGIRAAVGGPETQLAYF